MLRFIAMAQMSLTREKAMVAGGSSMFPRLILQRPLFKESRSGLSMGTRAQSGLYLFLIQGVMWRWNLTECDSEINEGNEHCAMRVDDGDFYICRMLYD